MVIHRIVVAFILSVGALILSLPMIVISGIFWLVRSTTRVLADLLEPDCTAWEEMMEFDEEVGWKPRANLDEYCVSVRDPEVFHVVTDDEGWPGRRSIEDSDVVVFGDSIAFGYAIDHDQSFAQMSGRLRVKSISAPGYDLVQSLLLMRRLAHRLEGKLVVWLVYYGNDLYDNLSPEMNGYRTPFVKQDPQSGEWEVVSKHVSPQPWRASRGQGGGKYKAVMSELHRPSWLAQRAMSACRYLLSEGKRVCEGAGASLAVVAVPSPYFLDDNVRKQREAPRGSSSVPDEAMQRIGHELQLTVALGSEYLTRRHFRPTDDHWNHLGHQRMAGLIQELYDSSAQANSAPKSAGLAPVDSSAA